jgi:hypothetical protein
VSRADLPDRCLGVLREAASWIGAKQGEHLFVAKLVPEMFQPHCRPAMALPPEHGHHFAERAHAAPLPAGAGKKGRDFLGEEVVVWPPVHDKLRKHFLGVKRNILILRAGGLDIESLGPKPILQNAEMRRGRNDVSGWAATSSFSRRVMKSWPDVFFKKQIRASALDL